MYRWLRSAIGSAIVACITSHAACGSESDVQGGPIGGTDIRNALLPAVPGLYFGLADVPAYYRQVNGDNGKKLPGIHDIDVEANIIGGAAQYVYPFKLFGGTVASLVQFDYAPTSTLKIGNVGIRQTSVGWGDPYLDILKWSRNFGSFGGPPKHTRYKFPYGLTVLAAYSMEVPIGTYEPQKLAPDGHNVVFIIPNIAVTYMTAPNFLGDGAEFDAHLFFDFSAENHETDYQSGAPIDVDFALTERNKIFQFGVAGFYARQIQNDYQAGFLVAPNGKHFEALKLGPIVAVDFPKQHLTLKFKASLGVESRNTLDGTNFVLSAGFKF